MYHEHHGDKLWEPGVCVLHKKHGNYVPGYAEWTLSEINLRHKIKMAAIIGGQPMERLSFRYE